MDRSDLEYIRTLNDKIQGQLLRIEYLKSKALPGAIRYDDTGGNTPTVFDSLGDLYAEIDKVERKVDALIDKREALKNKALHIVLEVCEDYDERHIIYLRYLGKDPHTGDNLEWREVIYHVNRLHNIQERKIYQLHHNVVRKIESYKIQLTACS